MEHQIKVPEILKDDPKKLSLFTSIMETLFESEYDDVQDNVADIIADYEN